MATAAWMKERIEAFVRELSEELVELDESTGDCWLDAAEKRAVMIGDAVATAMLTRQVADCPVKDEWACPTCGLQGRWRGTRQRELITRRGSAEIAEPEYYCPCCRKAFFPADPRFGC
jgi:hypothetical protein